MTVTDNVLKKTEQKRHLKSIAMQSFVFDRSKQPENRAEITPQGIGQQEPENHKSETTGTDYE